MLSDFLWFALVLSVLRWFGMVLVLFWISVVGWVFSALLRFALCGICVIVLGLVLWFLFDLLICVLLVVLS